MFVDLHVHTTASDGTFQPQEAVACAKAQNLSAIAITDHDTIDGIKPAQEAGKQLGIEVIEGVELGCDLAGREIHILGYLIRRNSQVLLAALSNLAEERTARAQEMVRRL
ncbi:MAG TPA: PHP domain-containing protein, partial [Bacillota bacterium]|nr:PHP domain-containing protein [Bacillota bacterium]